MQTATTGLPVSPENSRSRQVEFLTIGGIVFVGLLLRLPLWMAPGPGRDEAAYHYWVHHPEPVFAPLLQAAVRCFEFIGSCSLWSLRGPVVLLGVVALMLNDRRLREAGASLNSRRLALATLAFTPWQSFAGSILHPDNFFLVGMLVLVIAVQRKQILLSAVVASSMVLAKPTGLLMLPVVWWLAGRLGTSPARPSAPSLRWRVTTSRLMLLSTLVAFVLLMDRSMLDGIANFGRMAGVVPLASRLSAWSLALVFLGGPLLLVLSIPGIRQRWTIMRHRGQSEARREAEAALAIAGIVLVFFISAAIFRDQFKANWVLPAFVLLWPIRLPRWPRSVLAVGLVLTVMGSVGQSIVFLQSGMGGSAKAVLTGIESVSNYELHASVREAKVSSSLTWHHRAAEYGDVSGFADRVAAGWDSNGSAEPLRWIVSDDYGLAAQVSWHLRPPDVRMVIPGDGIFYRTVPPLLRAQNPGGILVLAVRTPPGDIWDNLRITATLPELDHPVTGQIIYPCVAQLLSNGGQP